MKPTSNKTENRAATEGGPATATTRSGVASAGALGVPSRALGGTFHIQSLRLTALLCGASLLLTTLSFPPIGLWPLAYICLVPWAVCVCTVVRSAWLYAASYLLGVAFFAINVRWLWGVTPEGHVALCLWFGLSFPLAAWPVRHLFRRFAAPAALTLPIVWVAVEYVRGLTLAGFPWFYLGHTHYTVPRMIQIADVAGACGVSFLLAMVNGALTDLLIQPMVVSDGSKRRRSAKLPLSAGVTAVSVIGVYLYGNYRLSESVTTRTPGPKVAVLQQDFPYAVAADASNGISPEIALEAYLALAWQAAGQGPDLIVMPETAWPLELNKEYLEADSGELEAIRSRLYPTNTLGQLEAHRERCRRAERAIRAFVDSSGVAVVIGAAATQWRGTKTPPRVERYNSAYLFVPGKPRDRARYDKIHLVLFGEFVPFRYSSLHGVYEWLNALTPWGASGYEYSLSFGEGHRTFSAEAGSAGRTYRFATPICYEDVVAEVVRRFVRGPSGEKGVDYLLSLSNDGWFNHSGELEQHLAACVFRSVEFRVPMARSVNTGISAFVDSNGRMTERVKMTQKQRMDSAEMDAALAALESLADKAAARGSTFDESQTDVMEARRIIVERMPGALRTMRSEAAASMPAGAGEANEFGFLQTRMSDLLSRVMTRPVATRRAEWTNLARQARADRETLARWKKKPHTAPGFRVSQMWVDGRYSWYAQWGDWFARGCAAATGILLLDWLVHRLRRPSRRKQRRLAKRAARKARAAA